ncbi:hypothetical protein P4O66_014984 [Electrophorus voltai]|uniref:Uncharacterized protein n=1 Tax=Electrophorus voltai TaxID=2609070 RepID=A0AAD9DNB8_9TELE|nr:hypothetical protein P4O66_014984 [Electrophorus voltai]
MSSALKSSTIATGFLGPFSPCRRRGECSACAGPEQTANMGPGLKKRNSQRRPRIRKEEDEVRSARMAEGLTAAAPARGVRFLAAPGFDRNASPFGRLAVRIEVFRARRPLPERVGGAAAGPSGRGFLGEYVQRSGLFPVQSAHYWPGALLETDFPHGVSLKITPSHTQELLSSSRPRNGVRVFQLSTSRLLTMTLATVRPYFVGVLRPVTASLVRVPLLRHSRGSRSPRRPPQRCFPRMDRIQQLRREYQQALREGAAPAYEELEARRRGLELDPRAPPVSVVGSVTRHAGCVRLLFSPHPPLSLSRSPFLKKRQPYCRVNNSDDASVRTQQDLSFVVKLCGLVRKNASAGSLAGGQGCGTLKTLKSSPRARSPSQPHLSLSRAFVLGKPQAYDAFAQSARGVGLLGSFLFASNVIWDRARRRRRPPPRLGLPMLNPQCPRGVASPGWYPATRTWSASTPPCPGLVVRIKTLEKNRHPFPAQTDRHRQTQYDGPTGNRPPQMAALNGGSFGDTDLPSSAPGVVECRSQVDITELKGHYCIPHISAPSGSVSPTVFEPLSSAVSESRRALVLPLRGPADTDEYTAQPWAGHRDPAHYASPLPAYHSSYPRPLDPRQGDLGFYNPPPPQRGPMRQDVPPSPPVPLRAPRYDTMNHRGFRNTSPERFGFVEGRHSDPRQKNGMTAAV